MLNMIKSLLAGTAAGGNVIYFSGVASKNSCMRIILLRRNEIWIAGIFGGTKGKWLGRDHAKQPFAVFRMVLGEYECMFEKDSRAVDKFVWRRRVDEETQGFWFYFLFHTGSLGFMNAGIWHSNGFKIERSNPQFHPWRRSHCLLGIRKLCSFWI